MTSFEERLELSDGEEGIDLNVNESYEDGFDSDFFYETFLHPRFKPDRFSILACLKVDKHPDDDLILKNLDKAHIPWLAQESYNVDHLVKRQVAFKIQDTWLFKSMLEDFLYAQGVTAVTIFTQAAVTLIYRLYRKESLFRMSHEQWRHQMSELWKGLAHFGQEGGSNLEACKLIMLLLKDKKKYSLLIEQDVHHILYYSYRGCGYSGNFGDNRYLHEVPNNPPEIPIADEDNILGDILKVIEEMKSMPTPLKDDQYTRLLMALLSRKGVANEEADWLVGEAKQAMTVLKHKGLDYDLRYFLVILLDDFKENLKSQVNKASKPLYYLYSKRGYLGYFEWDYYRETAEIVEVAELRRITVGSRFIGRSHLIWAYYECGYGLPSELRDTVIKFRFTDEDHPPYHIYMAAMEVADIVGMTIVKLECFVYALFFLDDAGDFDEEKIKTLQSNFKYFFPPNKRESYKGVLLIGINDKAQDKAS